jgi:hypothetical protein
MLFVCCNCGGICEQLVAHNNIPVVEELAAAGYAKTVIDCLLLTAPHSSNTLEMLRLVHDQARNSNWQASSGDDEASAAARNKALLALNDVAGLMQTRWLTRAKINKAKTAVDAWVGLLKAHSQVRLKSAETGPAAEAMLSARPATRQ